MTQRPNMPTNGQTHRGMPRDVEKILCRVETELNDGNPEQALAAVSRAKFNSPWAINARATCLLRLGQYQDAVDLLRGLVLGTGGIVYRQDVPTVFQANFATALLAVGNLSGCLSMLKNIKDRQHPAVREVQAAIDRWSRDLPIWQKLRWRLGGEPAPPALDFPLGHVS
ncbi:MAG TPA: hypothetical protein VG826_21485 [Pirellulales bacterium]|nr:hypothetical protein [Pirellulales bacterium]